MNRRDRRLAARGRLPNGMKIPKVAIPKFVKKGDVTNFDITSMPGYVAHTPSNTGPLPEDNFVISNTDL